MNGSKILIIFLFERRWWYIRLLDTNFGLALYNLTASFVSQELMKMMGLSPSLSWIAWFIKYLGFMLVSVTFMTILMTIDFGNGAIMTLSEPSVIFVFLLVYTISTIMFAFMISTLFSRCKLTFHLLYHTHVIKVPYVYTAGHLIFFCQNAV